ncbi:MAG TPA: CoA transferase [Casimicrobiaceae bacterium]|nr:CoA transferase [Casimicrobiaceae bacterium]
MSSNDAASSRVRVVELPGGGIPSAYAAWLLARLGADVTQLVDCSHLAAAPSPIALALEVLRDGKRQADREAFDALLESADVIVGETSSLHAGDSAEALARRLPKAIVGVASIFGLDGPNAEYPATALDAQALSSVAWSIGEPSRAPLGLPAGIMEHQSGAMLAAGCVLGLIARDDSGAGRIVDIALADVLASYIGGNCRVFIHHNLRWHRSGRRASGSAGAYPYTILPCKDGQVCVAGRAREEWERFVKALGSPAWASQPRYKSLRAMGTAYPDEVDALVRPLLADKTMDELAAIALANNLIVSPLRSFSDVLATKHFHERGFLDGSRAGGCDVLVPGVPFRAIASHNEAAPDSSATLLATPAPAPRNTPDRAAGPLSGIRVLDFGWVWSAPWVGAMLAELGAQVIKVEHGARPDNARLSGRVFRNGEEVQGPTREMSPMFHQINHGKLGITLNAKLPEAVALVKRLAAMSDLVVENMSPGSMERAGLGYDDLRPVNPRIVMLSMSAAGQFGELASMRAYAPIMSSFAGLEGIIGYPGEDAIGALNFGLGDPNASVHGLLASLAAMRHARATGEGCLIDFSQVEATLAALRPYLLDAQVREAQPSNPGNRHPEMAPHGIYPASESDAWVTLAVADDTQWRALAALAPQTAWSKDPRFATAARRLADVDALDAAIGEWTATHARDPLVAKLRAAGIASSPVLSIEEQWNDPHFAARRIKRPVDIPHYGSEDVFRGPWRFSDFEPTITRRGPQLGEHNDFVFGEVLGLSKTEIAALERAGVIA